MKAVLFLSMLFMSFSVVSLKGQDVNWMTFEEAINAQQLKPKKIFIDMYTDWCKWCKLMDKTTFEDPLIAEYINHNFYAVKFDAEFEGDIEYKGKTYELVKNSRQKPYHELAAYLARNRLSYPTMIFLNEKGEVIQPVPGYQDPKSFEVIMTFIGGDHYMEIPWGQYQANFESSY